jgi:hypothetical protein
MAFAHGESGYGNWGCRCEVCRVAGRAERREREARKQAATVAGADRSGLAWTPAEDELAADRGLSSVEVALLLGRTYAAVSQRRTMLRRSAGVTLPAV